jgi:hypothetical protein
MAIPGLATGYLAQRLQDAAAGGSPDGNVLPVIIDVKLTYPCEHSTIPLPGALRMTATDIDSSALRPNHDIVRDYSDPKRPVSGGAAAGPFRLGCSASVLQGRTSARSSATRPTERTRAPQLAIPVSGLARG